MKSTLLLLVVFLLAFAESVAARQEPQTAPPHPQHPQTAGAPKPGDPLPVETAVQGPVGVRVSDTVSGYNSGGKRDPFMSLISARRAAAERSLGLPTRQTGLATVALVDARVTGVLRLGNNFMAVIEGPDKQSFNARPKDRLLDAVVKSIDATGVVFMEQTDPSAPPREIKKAIRRGAEVNR